MSIEIDNIACCYILFLSNLTPTVKIFNFLEAFNFFSKFILDFDPKSKSSRSNLTEVLDIIY
ncbi:hypothetical protein FORMB_12670 [Formosa sp. Hel1_33_131]|nr:hypothetical protein FORMB_12670 [Formosa sp. Hel1_33_131]